MSLSMTEGAIAARARVALMPERERRELWRRDYYRFASRKPDYFRNVQMLKKYGITLLDVEVMRIQQHNLCKLCGKEFVGTARAPLAAVVDHNHVTGKVRALLHNRCNGLLGALKDDPAFCRQAAEYLETH